MAVEEVKKEEGAKEEDFGKSGLAESADPSAKSVIAEYCVDCHNAGGDVEDIPYAPTAKADLWTMKPDGSDQRRLTNHPADDGFISWLIQPATTN